MSVLETSFDVFSIRFAERKKLGSFPSDSAKTLDGKLPEVLLQLFKEEGLFSFADGLFMFTDPLELKEINESWKLDPEENQIFLRTAFGDFFYWDGAGVNVMHVNTAVKNTLNTDIADFLNYTFSESYREQTLFGKFLKKAEANLGPFSKEECYAFVPALPAGGKENANNLQKVKLAEYLDMLSQLHQ